MIDEEQVACQQLVVDVENFVYLLLQGAWLVKFDPSAQYLQPGATSL